MREKVKIWLLYLVIIPITILLGYLASKIGV